MAKEKDIVSLIANAVNTEMKGKLFREKGEALITEVKLCDAGEHFNLEVYSYNLTADKETHRSFPNHSRELPIQIEPIDLTANEAQTYFQYKRYWRYPSFKEEFNSSALPASYF